MDELTALETADVQHRWAENGNPALGELLVGPYGVTLETDPDAVTRKYVTDEFRLQKTREACDAAWGSDREAARRCTARTFAIETQLWKGTLSPEDVKRMIAEEWQVPGKSPGMPPVPAPESGSFTSDKSLREMLLSPVGLLGLGIGAVILMLALRPSA